MRIRPSGVVLVGVAGLLAFVAAGVGGADEAHVVRVIPDETETQAAVPPAASSDPGPPCELTTTDTLDHETLSTQQRELFEDSRRVQAYGEQHPEEFGQTWFDNGPVVRIAVGFTARVFEHRAALESLVDHPDRLVVHRVPHSLRTLEDAWADVTTLIDAEASVPAFGGGVSLCSIHVELAAGLDDLAGRLLDRFGAVLDVSVGGHAFPVEPGRPLDCPAVAGDDAAAHGLVADVRLDGAGAAFRRGEPVTGTARVTNAGDEPITVVFGGGSAMAVVVEPGTRRPIGISTTGRDDSLGSLGLAPGEAGVVPFTAGVSACDPSGGSAVPSGRHGLIVPLEIVVGTADPTDDSPQPAVTWLSPEVPVVIES
ncbi:MAG: hypothetical protein ACRD29_02795 [Acidimicrobiales bacterium]